MPVKFNNGVVHLIDDHETKERWGKTFCGLRFTVKKRFKAALVQSRDVSPATHAKTYVSCLSCIGSKL